MLYEIAMERLLSAVIASMPYWGWDGVSNFVGYALLIATLAGTMLFSLMIWGLVTKIIEQGVSSLRRRLRSGARPDGGVVAEPGDTTAEQAQQQRRPERQVPSSGRATLRVRDRQRAQPQPQLQQRHLGLPCQSDQVRSPEHPAKLRKPLDQERWLERNRHLIAQRKLLDRDGKAKQDQEWLERNPNRYAQALHQDWEKKVKKEQQTRERKKLQQQEREREARQGQQQLRQEKEEPMDKACNRVHKKVDFPCLRDQVRLPEYLAKSRKRSDPERLERIRIGVAQACQQDRKKKAKLEQDKREREKLQQQERERQENQQRLRQEEADEQARRQHEDWLWEQGLQELLQRERERDEQKLQQREKKKMERQQQEREWERKNMARQQELEQLKLRQQEQELERKKKVEQEREAYFGRIWQREREREKEWEQEWEQKRDRRAQRKMQQEQQQWADDHAKSHEGLQHGQQTSQQQQQQLQQLQQQQKQQQHQQHQQHQRQGLYLGDSHAVRNTSEAPPPCPGRDPGATWGTPTERRRGATSVLTTTVKRALRMAGTEAEARRITLSAVLRIDRDVPESSTGLPQQQIRERVEHTLDFLCSPEASGLGRKRRMGSGKKVSKTIFWAHVGAIARQSRLAKADALPGSTEQRCNTGGVLPPPRPSSPRGQEQREVLGQHERQQRGIPQTTVEARLLPGLTRGDPLKVEHPPKSSSGGFSMGREGTRQEVQSSFVKPTSGGGKTVNALPFLPIPPVGPVEARRKGAFGVLTTVEARLLPGLLRDHSLKVEHPPKSSSGGFSMGKRPTTQEMESSFLMTTSGGGKTVNALPFLPIPPVGPLAGRRAGASGALTTASSLSIACESNPEHTKRSRMSALRSPEAVVVVPATPTVAILAASVTVTTPPVPVTTGTEETPTHGTVSASITAAAAATVSVATGPEEEPTHGAVSAYVTAAAPAVSVTTTETEEGAHDGGGSCRTNQTSVACTVMSIPELPKYEQLRAGQEAQIRRNRPATKTDPLAPDTTVGDTRGTSTAVPVTPKTEQPFERVKQGK
ncbi:unnamed protein product [Ectocarpus sp. 12 AP-2014]